MTRAPVRQDRVHAHPPRRPLRRLPCALPRVPRHQARGLGRRRAGGAGDHRGRGGARRRGADRADRKFDRVDLGTIGLRVTAGRAGRRDRGLRAGGARRAEARARPHRGLSPPPDAEGRPLHRRARRRARASLDRDRGGRALRAGRHRGLSVLGADERGAGQGRRRAAHRDGGADARRRAQSAGAGGGASSPASTRSIASAARRRSRRSPMAPRRSRRSPRSSGRATPMWRRPSARCSARSAST